MSGNTNELKNLVNRYSADLLKSIENKSFTEENIKNMLLTNARILALINDMVSKLGTKNKLNDLSNKIKIVQNKLNNKLNKSIYNSHTHEFTGVADGTQGTTNKPNSS